MLRWKKVIVPLDSIERRMQLVRMSDPVSHPIYEVLKDFQPTLAALIALLAACIAFFGATSKTRLDKQIARQLHEREKLGIYQRFKYEVALIRVLTNGMVNDKNVDRDLAKADRSAESRKHFAYVRRLLEEIPETKAAWQKLELFPTELSDRINLLRARIFVITIALDENIYPVFPSPDAKIPTKLSQVAAEVASIATDVGSELEKLISQTAKNVRLLN